MKNLIITIAMCSIFFGTQAQPDSINWRFAQISFFYPLGTNGTSTNYTNTLSFNVLAGVNGGLWGAEVGGIANINRGNVYGAQASGGININKAKMNGVQMSTLMNLNMGDVTAGQFSEGININKGDFFGISAGLINYNGKNTTGTQLSGILNYTQNNTSGAQISALFNMNGDTLNGTQIGFINKTRVLNGTQIGFINIITDSSENAVPIGIFNYMPNGVAEIELAANEVLYGNLYFRFGGRHFYTLLKTGFGINRQTPVSSFGIGLGTRMYFGKKSALAFEAETNQLSDSYYLRIRKLDLLNSMSLSYRYQINDKLAFSAGPAYNTYITQKSGKPPYAILDVPYTVLKEEWSSITIYDWIGGRIGISYCF